MVTGSSAWARAVSRSAVKLGEPRPEASNRLGQVPHVPAGEVLLVGVVLPQGSTSRCSSASASASVSTAGLPEAMAFTSA